MHSIPYTQQIVKLGISLHYQVIKTLVNEVRTAITNSRIRTTENLHSVFDFLREILGLKSERKVWERLQVNNPDTVRICHSVKFPRSDGKQANLESPASDLAGLIYIAYCASCDYSEQLRSASAALFASELITDDMHDPIAPAYDDPCFPYSVSQLTEVANYSNDKYSRAVIRRDFVERLHFVIVGREMRLTDKCLMLAINSSRSKRGIEYNKLPMIALSPAESLTYHQAKAERKTNSRLPRRSKWECEGQLSLNLFPES